MNEPRVLLVVATLGRRPEFLRETLDSIRAQTVVADIVMVAPLDSTTVQEAAREYGIRVLPDPGSLPGAINLGAGELQPHHEYFNWLNDDDLLEEGSLATTVAALDRDPSAVVAYGACRYIDPKGRQLWISRAGKWATRVLNWGPDLIPQPGMLVRSDAWRAVGGVDESFRLAFDLDLLLKLKKLGPFAQVPAVVSSFRWHPDSLTVDDRTTNLAESERAKRASLSPRVRRLTWIWEPPVRVATRFAAGRVQQRAHRLSAS
ncbi:MAG: glycosyltransferase [Candidatus Nanopelagicales bacterium]|nr:glycosyltransferase [Candidatus Nanopelagicales bacterium]